MIKSFPAEFIDQLRGIYADYTAVTIQPVALEIVEMVLDCHDPALIQLAQGRIRFVSMAALAECWGRGIFLEEPTYDFAQPFSAALA